MAPPGAPQAQAEPQATTLWLNRRSENDTRFRLVLDCVNDAGAGWGLHVTCAGGRHPHCTAELYCYGNEDVRGLCEAQQQGSAALRSTRSEVLAIHAQLSRQGLHLRKSHVAPAAAPGALEMAPGAHQHQKSAKLLQPSFKVIWRWSGTVEQQLPQLLLSPLDVLAGPWPKGLPRIDPGLAMRALAALGLGGSPGKQLALPRVEGSRLSPQHVLRMPRPGDYVLVQDPSGRFFTFLMHLSVPLHLDAFGACQLAFKYSAHGTSYCTLYSLAQLDLHIVPPVADWQGGHVQVGSQLSGRDFIAFDRPDASRDEREAVLLAYRALHLQRVVRRWRARRRERARSMLMTGWLARAERAEGCPRLPELPPCIQRDIASRVVGMLGYKGRPHIVEAVSAAPAVVG